MRKRLVLVVVLEEGVDDDAHLRDSLRDHVIDYTMSDGPSQDDPAGPFGPAKAFPVKEVTVIGVD